MDRTEMLGWLQETRPERLAELWRRADEARRRHVGEEVHLRGLLEISNHCVRECAYCGIRAGHQELPRYRMTEAEILACAAQAAAFGYGTVVLQAGEDYGLRSAWLAGIVRQIKAATRLAVTLSLGERTEEELAAWRDAGADRYLLRFETSDQELYRRIHPAPGSAGFQPANEGGQDGRAPRIALLRLLKKLGYETGSGVMIGLPGQSYTSLVNDLELFRTLDLDMIGVGPYIPHPATPLYVAQPPSAVSQPQMFQAVSTAEGGCATLQAPNTEEMAYKMVALTRLVCPEANIPSTTALATLNPRQGRELGLCRGANVLMPNLTPLRYRALYEIYPAKACIHEDAIACRHCLEERILALGRRLGRGQGGRVQGGAGEQGNSRAVERQLPQ